MDFIIGISSWCRCRHSLPPRQFRVTRGGRPWDRGRPRHIGPRVRKYVRFVGAPSRDRSGDRSRTCISTTQTGACAMARERSYLTSGPEGKLDQLVKKTWCAYDNVASLSVRVSPAAPILFFGDLDSYTSSMLRVLTVGLNPSRREFPADKPFLRFPSSEEPAGRDPCRYLESLSSYYRTRPYRTWFRSFEHILNGAGTSYYPGETSTALHTDICSPIATDPTWSHLCQADRSTLEADGSPLWHMLLKVLKPQLVFLSVAKSHLRRIEFEPLDNQWNVLITYDRTGSGAPRLRPYQVQGRSYDVGGEPSLFIFGTAAQTPFGLVSDLQKRDIGLIALEAYRDGR